MLEIWRRMSVFLFPTLFLLASPATAAGCYDIGKGEPRSLSGKISYVLATGQPGYGYFQQGDEAEPFFALDLDRPICLTGDEYADPHKPFKQVQLKETDATRGALRHYVGKHVVLTLVDPMPEVTGHQHRPLTAAVNAVRLTGSGVADPFAGRAIPKFGPRKQLAVPPAMQVPAQPVDYVDEYGTPATVIRAFYAVLRDGQGWAAAIIIDPAKRTQPGFSPKAFSRFYGDLAEPIDLIEIARRGANDYIVRYHYGTQTSVCDGAAQILTVKRRGMNYISMIKPLNGC